MANLANNPLPADPSLTTHVWKIPQHIPVHNALLRDIPHLPNNEYGLQNLSQLYAAYRRAEHGFSPHDPPPPHPDFLTVSDVKLRYARPPGVPESDSECTEEEQEEEEDVDYETQHAPATPQPSPPTPISAPPAPIQHAEDPELDRRNSRPCLHTEPNLSPNPTPTKTLSPSDHIPLPRISFGDQTTELENPHTKLLSDLLVSPAFSTVRDRRSVASAPARVGRLRSRRPVPHIVATARSRKSSIAQPPGLLDRADGDHGAERPDRLSQHAAQVDEAAQHAQLASEVVSQPETPKAKVRKSVTFTPGEALVNTPGPSLLTRFMDEKTPERVADVAESSKQLVYAYASTVSPGSRRVSCVPSVANSRSRPDSVDVGLQPAVASEDVLPDEAELSVARRKSCDEVLDRAENLSQGDVLAGFIGVNRGKDGVLTCEIDGRTFELVVEEVSNGEDAHGGRGVQCSPAEIDAAMEVLFARPEELITSKKKVDAGVQWTSEYEEGDEGLLPSSRLHLSHETRVAVDVRPAKDKDFRDTGVVPISEEMDQIDVPAESIVDVDIIAVDKDSRSVRTERNLADVSSPAVCSIARLALDKDFRDTDVVPISEEMDESDVLAEYNAHVDNETPSLPTEQNLADAPSSPAVRPDTNNDDTAILDLLDDLDDADACGPSDAAAEVCRQTDPQVSLHVEVSQVEAAAASTSNALHLETVKPANNNIAAPMQKERNESTIKRIDAEPDTLPRASFSAPKSSTTNVHRGGMTSLTRANSDENTVATDELPRNDGEETESDIDFGDAHDDMDDMDIVAALSTPAQNSTHSLVPIDNVGAVGEPELQTPQHEMSQRCALGSSASQLAPKALEFAQPMLPLLSPAPLRRSTVVMANGLDIQPEHEEEPGVKKPSKKGSKPGKAKKIAKPTKSKGTKRGGPAPNELKRLGLTTLRVPPVAEEQQEDLEEIRPRRSKRRRFPPLQYWKNEKKVYNRRMSQIMPTIAEVVVAVENSSDDESGISWANVKARKVIASRR